MSEFLDLWVFGLAGGLSCGFLGVAEGESCSECGTPIPAVRQPKNWREALWGGWTCRNCGCEFDRWGRLLSGAPAAASDPGGITLSHAKLRILRPDLYGMAGFMQWFREKTGLTWEQIAYLPRHLENGDSRAAVVVSTAPLLVAAYTDELDCVAVLKFPEEFVEDYELRVGSRLLTINTYKRQERYDPDLILGETNTENWTGFHPIIAEFVSDDEESIELRKRKIADEEWRRTQRLGREYLQQKPGLFRDGRPVYAGVPATLLRTPGRYK